MREEVAPWAFTSNENFSLRLKNWVIVSIVNTILVVNAAGLFKGRAKEKYSYSDIRE